MGEISFHGLSLHRGGFALEIDALNINHGEKIALLGENGSGKSTLLNIIAGLLDIDAGKIEYDGARWDRFSASERARYIAYLPQEADVLFNLSVEDLIELSLERAPKNKDEILAATAMQSYLTRVYHSLSGGEKRRAMLARVLSMGKPFVLLDEPTAPLDMRHSSQLMRYISNIDSAVIAAIHDVNLAIRYFDRFLLMKHGKIIFDKRRDELDAKMLEEIYEIRFKGDINYFIPDI